MDTEIVDNSQLDGRINLEVPVGITVTLIIELPYYTTRIKVIDMSIVIVDVIQLVHNGGEISENC